MSVQTNPANATMLDHKVSQVVGRRTADAGASELTRKNYRS